MAKIKVKSKRVGLHLKASIKRRAKEHDRKARRDAKANPHLRKKLKKDMGIPNLNPFKASMLARLESQKKSLHEKQRSGLGGAAALVADAVERGAGYTEAHPVAPEGAIGGGGSSSAAAEGVPRGADRLLAGNTDAGGSTRRAFFKHLRSVMEKADIILEVLDARDPLACRSAAVESLALAQKPPKRVVLVLNKIDLVPPAAVQAWLLHLRKEFPTIAFKASTQQQRTHLAAPGGGTVNKATQAGEVLTGSGAAGADTLLQLIKNYARSHDIKRAVTVGVVGYPNVGKSSIINSLKRSKAVGVSATPGFTRCMQEVSLDAKVTLLDCPGIIFDDPREEGEGAGGGGEGSSSRSDGGAGLLLRNCIAVDQIEDPEAAVEGILRRCAPAKLMALFCIPAYASTDQFLGHVAAKRFMVGRGGVPDKRKAARVVLQEWNSGKIPFFVMPPGAAAAAAAGGGGGMEEEAAPAGKGALRVTSDDLGLASIVTEWSKVSGVCVCCVCALCVCVCLHAEVNGLSLYLHGVTSLPAV
jgi:nuclear GTP-binding protein